MNASDDPERIEREIADTRTSMTSTLTELERKLSARQITNDVFDAMREAVVGSGEGSTNMIEIIRRNPIATALIGIGIGWMVLGAPRARQRPHGANGGYGDAPATTGNGEGMVRRTGAAVQSNPAALGGLGLALGALLGTLLPMSREESGWLGRAQRRMLDQAEQLGRDALERARSVADEASRAALDAVDRELGLDHEPDTKVH